jgi:hypothetical protein
MNSMIPLKDYCTENKISYVSAYQAFHRGDIPGAGSDGGWLYVPADCSWRPARRGRPVDIVPRAELQRIWQYQKRNYGTGYPLPDVTVEQMVRLGEKYRLNQVEPSLIETCFKVFQSLTVEQLEDPELEFAKDEIIRRWQDIIGRPMVVCISGSGFECWLGLFFEWATTVGSMAVRRYRKQVIASYNRVLAEYRVQMFAAEL